MQVTEVQNYTIQNTNKHWHNRTSDTHWSSYIQYRIIWLYLLLYWFHLLTCHVDIEHTFHSKTGYPIHFTLYTRQFILFICMIMCRSYRLFRQPTVSVKTWQADNSWEGLKLGNLLWVVLSNICLNIGWVCYLSHGSNFVRSIIYSV
jgi:hypothetical protein